MEENNVFVAEEVMTEVATEDKDSRMGTGAAMLLGGLLTAGTMYGVKKVKGIIAKRKAKKEAESDGEEPKETDAKADTKKKSK